MFWNIYWTLIYIRNNFLTIYFSTKKQTNFLLGLITSIPVRILLDDILYYYTEYESLYFSFLNIFWLLE